MELIMLLLVFAAGGFLAVQGPMNGGHVKSFGRHQFTTVSFVFLIGSIFMMAIFLFTGGELPSLAKNTTLWWHWTGGFLGAFYVASITFAVPQIGAAFAMSLVLLGRVVFSVITDQFGLLGMAAQSTSLLRMLGVLLVFAGAMLVSNYKPAQAPAATLPEQK